MLVCAYFNFRQKVSSSSPRQKERMKKKKLVAKCSRGGRVPRLRCKMDSYKFMNSVRKVKRRQYDNLAVIAFFSPSNCFSPEPPGSWDVAPPSGAASAAQAVGALWPRSRGRLPRRKGSSGGYTKYTGLLGNGIAIISTRMVNYMFN